MLSNPISHCCRSHRSWTIQSLNLSIPVVKASDSTNQLVKHRPIIIYSVFLPLQTRHHWSGSSPSNLKTACKYPCCRRSQRLDAVPKDLDTDLHSTCLIQASETSAREASAFRIELDGGLSIAASRQTCILSASQAFLQLEEGWEYVNQDIAKYMKEQIFPKVSSSDFCMIELAGRFSEEGPGGFRTMSGVISRPSFFLNFVMRRIAFHIAVQYIIR